MILPNVSARRQSATMTPKLAEVHELLRHELSLSPSGAAKLTWPLFFRPMHDALIEESLDRAEREFSSAPIAAHRWSLWTKILRAPFSVRMTRKQGAQ